MPVVHPRPAFEQAVIERIAWLREHAPEEWLDDFLTGLAAVRRDLERFPEAWPVVKQDERVVLRARPFPDPLPYIVYYTHLRERPIGQVFLSRLLHQRQRRLRFRLADWPW